MLLRADSSAGLKANLAAAVDEADSASRAWAADFTKLNLSGKYYLEVPGAGKTLQAARRAWTWLEKFPDVMLRNPEGVNTGGCVAGVVRTCNEWGGPPEPRGAATPRSGSTPYKDCFYTASLPIRVTLNYPKRNGHVSLGRNN